MKVKLSFFCLLFNSSDLEHRIAPFSKCLKVVSSQMKVAQTILSFFFSFFFRWETVLIIVLSNSCLKRKSEAY